MNGIDRIAADNIRAELAAWVSRQRALLAKVHAPGCRVVSCQREVDSHPSPACLLLRERIRAAYSDAS